MDKQIYKKHAQAVSAILFGATLAFLMFKLLVENNGAMAVFKTIVEAQGKWQYAVALSLFLFAFCVSDGGDSNGTGGGTRSEISPTIEPFGA